MFCLQKLEEKFNANEEQKVQLQKTLKVIHLKKPAVSKECELRHEIAFFLFSVFAGKSRK